MIALSELLAHAVAQPTFPAQQLLTHDLIGASLAADRDLLPPDACTMSESQCLNAWRAAYRPESTGSTQFAHLPLRHIDNARDMRTLVSTWLVEVGQHPVAYLTRRWAIAEHLFIGAPFVAVFAGNVPNPLELDIHPTPRAQAALWLPRRLSTSAAFAGALYLLYGALALVLTRARAPVINGLVGSGWLYAAGHFFVATEADYRFNAWVVVSGVVALALALAPRARATLLRS